MANDPPRQLHIHNDPPRQLQKKIERKVNVVEMLRRICGVSLADRIHNKEIHRMACTSEDVTVRMKKNVFSWFGHVERMSNEIMVKKI